MRKLLLFFFALLTSVSGAWATDVKIANTSEGLPNTFGSFSGQVFTTSVASGMAAVTVTAQSGLTIGEQTVNSDNYGKCFKFVTAAAATDYKVTMEVPDGYVITGYSLGCSANTYNAVHTLTSEDGAVSVVASAPPYNNPTGPKAFDVRGLKAQSTYFTINTANSGNTLYLPTFTIYVEDENDVFDVNYKVMYEGVEKGTNVMKNAVRGAATELPAALSTTEYIPYSCTYTLDKATITEAGETITATVTWNYPLSFTADDSSPIYYNLNIRSKYLAYNDEATGDVELLASSTPFNPDAAWAFIGDPYTGFQIINQTNGKDKYLTYTSVVTERHSDNNIQFVDASSFTNQYWYVDTNSGGFCLRMKENPNIYFHHDSGNNYLRTCSTTEWGSVHNDAGSTLVFASDEDVLVALYNELKDVFFADGVGNYTWNGSGTAEEARANINGAGTALAVHATSSYKALYDALIEIKNNIALNSPTAGFYRIKGKTSGKYLAAGMTGGKFSMTDAEDATTIFYFDGTNLTNLSSGMCNGVTASTWAWDVVDNASTVTFHDGHTPSGYGIQTETAYFYDNGDNSASADRGTSVNMSSGNVRYRSWDLTEITTLPVTITAAKYATLYSPVALTIPTGVTAYIASDKGSYLQLTAIEGGIIPANEGVILAGEAGTYGFAVTTGGSVAGNALTGTTVAISRPSGSYILATGSADVGFYQDGAGTIPGFKAYLADGSGPVKAFVFDEETAVKAIEAAMNPNKVVYDMNGRRVENPAKGIYIVNGKKVIIK